MSRFQEFVSHRRLSTLLASGLVAIALASCAPPSDMRGNAPDKVALSQIKPGVTDKASVTQLLGSPSSVATFDANTWYYISQETKNVAFFKPEILDQKVVAIAFDDKGVVRGVSYRSLGDGQHIEPNPNATPAPGREFTFLEQLLGNFGRFGNTNTSPGGQGPGH
jgi:outer membrane protein assembly factor BamE (lipoprotein component of BamABCDE complex)